MFYGQLYPKVMISYDREAFYDRADKSFRITFDENILWRQEEVSLGKEIYGQRILKPGLALMEIKTGNALPLWLVKILSDEKIYRTTFSKYGSAYIQMIGKHEEGGCRHVG